MKYRIFLDDILVDELPDLIFNKQNDNFAHISLKIFKDGSLEEALSNENITNAIKKEYETLIQTQKDFEDMSETNYFDETISDVKELLSESQNRNVLDNIEFIVINPSEMTMDYIKRNPIISTKKILLSNKYALSWEEYNNITSLFGENENIYINVEGNKNPVSIQEYKSSLIIVDEIINRIKKYDLSPLEQTMFAYDIVRDRVYQKEEEEESPRISRDLTSVLQGNKIVCLGYANILNAVLKGLNINSMVYLLHNEEIGHARNVVRITDKKYKVDGIYFFDATFDSKKSEESNNHFKKYDFFAKTKGEISPCDSSRFNEETFNGLSPTTVIDFYELVEEKGITAVSRKTVDLINQISRFVDGKGLISMAALSFKSSMLPKEMRFDQEKVVERLFEYEDLFFESSISPDTLLKVMYNVRKIEYYEEPEKYPFDVETFRSAVVKDNALGLNDKNRKLYRALRMGLAQLTRMNQEDFDICAKDMNLEQNIGGVKLTSVLNEELKNRIR